MNRVKENTNKINVFLNLKKFAVRTGGYSLNKNLFRAMHTAHGDTQKQVADYIGITEQTLSAKVNGETDFKHSEIKLLIDRYGLTPEQVDQIFF